MGADRVRDVLIDQAINGMPEPIVFGGKVVGERRRFNHRTMQWVLQHHKPDEYPGGRTLQGGLQGMVPAPTKEEAARIRREIGERVDRLSAHRREKEAAKMQAIAGDPERRAAYELLAGPTDWEQAVQVKDLSQEVSPWLGPTG